MIIAVSSLAPHLSEVQGKTEQRTEAYKVYDEGAAEVLTQQFAKRLPTRASFARLAGKPLRRQR